MVVASLGVSKGGGGGKVAERVLSISFMTDPVLKPTDLAGKGAAAMASLMGSVGSAAAKYSSSIGNSSGGGSGALEKKPREAGTATTATLASGASLSAVEIANARSNQRADSLLQAVVAELGNIGWNGGATDRETGGCVVPAAARSSKSEGFLPEKHGASQNDGGAVDSSTGAEESAHSATRHKEELVLAPFDGSSGGNGSSPGVSGAAVTVSSSSLSPEKAGGQGGQEAEAPGDGVGSVGSAADKAGVSTSTVEVRFARWVIQQCMESR